tara:strand:- start:124 stop:279 length:156 start_codon:yes stop_codon:yes gene_type:complete
MASLLLREGDRLCIAASLLSPPLLVDARKRQSKEEKVRPLPNPEPDPDLDH